MSVKAFLAAVALALLAGAPAAAKTHFVILGGLGGEALYAKQFEEQAAKLKEICEKTAGDEALVHALYGNAVTRENVVALLESLAQETTPDDAVVVFLIGHGTYDGYDYRFNIRGPDITGTRLKKLLDAIPAREQLVVNTTSASGATMELLKSEHRAVITATKSGGERTITVFPQYWVEALSDPAADTDKNDIITAAEAFRYAEDKVKTFYETEKRLATEHPRLEGELAGAFTLARLGSAREAAEDPRTRGLLAEREDLERQIESLRRKKDQMAAEKYQQQLETLLIELARLQARLDALVNNEEKP